MVAVAWIVTALGVWLLVSALANWDWYKAVADFAAAEAILGEGAARWLCGVTGLLCVGFGVAGVAGML